MAYPEFWTPKQQQVTIMFEKVFKEANLRLGTCTPLQGIGDGSIEYKDAIDRRMQEQGRNWIWEGIDRKEKGRKQQYLGLNIVILLSLVLLSVLGKQRLVNVRNNSTTSNSSLDKRVQFFISSNGQLQVSWSNSLDLEILGSVSSELQYFSSKILQDSSSVDSSSGSYSLVLGHSSLDESMNSSNWELGCQQRILLVVQL